MPAIVQHYICLQPTTSPRQHNYYATSNFRTYIRQSTVPRLHKHGVLTTNCHRAIHFLHLQVNIEMRGLVFPDIFVLVQILGTYALRSCSPRFTQNRKRTGQIHVFFFRLKISPVILLNTHAFNHSFSLPPKPNIFFVHVS